MSYKYLKNDFGENILLKNNVPLVAFVRNDSKLTKFIMVNSFSSYDYDVNVIYLTAKMLLEGTKKYSYDQLADIIDFYGSEVKTSTESDANVFSMTVLNEYFENLFDIFNEIFNNPVFSTERLDFVKTKAIEKLKIENSKNTTKALKKLRQVIYQEKTPYGTVCSEEGLQKVTVDDIKTCFYDLWFKQSKMFVTGPNTSVEYIKENVSDVFFCGGKKSLSEIVMTTSSPQIITIHDNTCKQVSIALGNITIPVTHDDYFKLLCAVTFFGGGYLGSRLMQAIREKKGLTYGISASIVTQRYSNFLCIYTSAKKEFKDEIVQAIAIEIERLKAELVSSAELDNFKRYYCGEIISSFTDIFSQMHHMISTKILDMNDGYYYDLFMTVQQLTAEDIQQCAIKYLDFKNFSQVFIE